MIDQGYQFWSKTDKDGYFFINNIRVGNYNIYAWVPGVIGDYRYDDTITITTGLIIYSYKYIRLF